MKSHDLLISREKKIISRKWECCGNSWELLYSPSTFKDRAEWSPTCPSCGDVGKSLNVASWKGEESDKP